MIHESISLFRYVFDSSSLIFIERKRLVTRLRRRHGEILLPEKVAEEVRQPRSPLKTLLDRFPTMIVSFTSAEEQKYLEIRAQAGIDDGEAAAITIALSRSMPLVIEDKKGRSKAQNHGIHCFGWQEFITGT
ncbi:MAG: hypothetical protein ACE5JU_15395 [Candidatus Binatia bacterium]